MNKHILVLKLLIMISVVSVAQMPRPAVNLPSPTAAGLATVAEVPVSHFTGIPNINVPIHTVKEGSIEVPVSLDYYAAGVKPDEHPGWVGLNWNLMAGGAITRVVNDLPDEFDSRKVDVKRFHYYYATVDGAFPWWQTGINGEKKGYYYTRGVNNVSNWSSSSRIKQLAEDKDDAKDTEPDRFVFNFLSYTGEFYLGHDGKWYVKSDQDIKVVFDGQNIIDVPEKLQQSEEKHPAINCLKGNIKTFGGFTLITASGTKYHFGAKPGQPNTDAIEYSIPMFSQQSNHWIATSWYLTEIESPEGKKVTFTYQPDDYIVNMAMSFNWEVLYLLTSRDRIACALYGRSYGFGDDEWTADWINPRYSSIMGNLVRPVYLRSINASTETVYFDRSASSQLKYPSDMMIKNSRIQDVISTSLGDQICEALEPMVRYQHWIYLYDEVNSTYHPTQLAALSWKKLDMIRVDDNNSSKSLRFKLDYNNNSDERLFLEKVTQLKPNGKPISRGHRFEYYDDYDLPPYISESIDHWGYFNNNSIKCLTQRRSAEFAGGGDPCFNNLDLIRRPSSNVNVTRSGSLKKIHHPTSGTTEFQYEKNDYSKSLGDSRTSIINESTDQRSGGLRIKKILYKDENNAIKNQKTFYYKSNYAAGANLSNLRSSGISGGQIQYAWADLTTNTGNSTVDKIAREVVTSQSLNPWGVNMQGYHIGYSEVAEVERDGSYTVYTFTNFTGTENHFDEAPLPGAFTTVSPYNPYSDKSIERGKIRFIDTYDKDNNAVTSEEFRYAKTSSSYVRALHLEAAEYACSGDRYLSYIGFPYKHYFYKYNVTRKYTDHYHPSNNTVLSDVENYAYVPGNYATLRSKSNTNSDGKVVSTTYRYALDFNPSTSASTSTDAGAIRVLKNDFFLTPIESITRVNNAVVAASVSKYRISSGRKTLKEFYDLEVENPITDYRNSYLSGNNLLVDSDSKLKNQYSFNSEGNLTQVKHPNQLVERFGWIYGNNTEYRWLGRANDHYAYTSFEKLTSSNQPTGGNWTYSNMTTVSGGYFGKRYGKGNASGFLSRSVKAGTYNVSFWTTGTVTVNVGGSTKTPVKVSQRGSWSKYEVTFTNTATQTVKLTTSSNIDEVRLYPLGSEFSTFSYKYPMYGPGSFTGIDEQVEFYDYEDIGRLKSIRQTNGSAVESYDYNYGFDRRIGLSGSSLNFGEVATQLTKTLSFTINNVGRDDVTISSVSKPSGFTVSYSGAVIPAGGSKTITVSFKPTSIASYSGNIVVNTDATGNNTVSVSGSGVLGTRLIGTFGSFMLFESTPLGSSNSQNLHIRNSGNSPLRIYNVTSNSSNFRVDQKPTTINPGSSGIVKVTFTPFHTSTYSGTLTITSNDTAGNTSITVGMSGTGTSNGGGDDIFIKDEQ